MEASSPLWSYRGMPRRLSLAVVLFLASVACSSAAPKAVSAEDWKNDPREPYPFTTPVPGHAPTEIDGVYRREVSADEVGETVPCRRCAPYRIYVGGATIEFEEGRFHIGEEGSSFGSSGHYAVDGDEVTLFNDLVCPALEATYAWSLEDGTLVLDIANDPCAFDNLRGRYLTSYDWAERG